MSGRRSGLPVATGRGIAAVRPLLHVVSFGVGLFCLFIGCDSRQPPELPWQAFDGARAYEHVEKIVGFGPRPSGSAALEKTAAYISQKLQSYGLIVEEQVFTASTPHGPVKFRNVIGKTRGGRGGPGSVIVIGSHYDTKLMPDIEFVGANDGGSSVGVLLEMARVASAQPDLWFVFFDGEECFVEYGPNDGFWGSKYFVEQLKAKDRVGWIKAMVLLDMVGDADLNITIPADSTTWLVQRVFDAARDTGHRDRFSFRNAVIFDDHVPFLEAGAPAVNLIDFDFGSAPGRNDYWHTDKDTLDKVSPTSLTAVGQTTLRLLTLLRQNSTAH